MPTIVFEVAEHYVGAATRRVEDPRLLTGSGGFVADVKLPRELHAAFVRSPHAHARVLSVDSTGATGVMVFSGASLAGRVPVLRTVQIVPGMRTVERQLLATDRVRFVGEAVAVVLAESRYLAEDAAERVKVEYEPLPVVADWQAAREHRVLLHADVPDNTFVEVEEHFGQTDQAFAEADRVFRLRFRGNRQSACPIETRGIVASFDSWTDELTLWTATQVPHTIRTLLAQLLRHPENKLRVISPDVGGAFGLKLHFYNEDFLIPFLAKELRRPVRWIEDRSEELLASTHGKDQVVDIEAAMSAGGHIKALRGLYVLDSGAYSQYPRSNLSHSLGPPMLLPSAYDVRNVDYTSLAVLTNKCPIAAYRGVGWTQAHVARELLLDEAARAVGIDPLDLRLANLIPDGHSAYPTATGMTFDGGSYAAATRKAADLIGYQEFRAQQRSRQQPERYLGVGINPFVEPTGWGTAGARTSGVHARLFDSATVSMDPSGKVVVATGTHSQGQGHLTVFAQLAAQELGIGLEDIRVIEGDTAVTPFGSGAFASRSAVVAGGAVIRASREIRTKLLRLAGHMLEIAPDDLDVRAGTIAVRGTPERALAVAEVARAAYYAVSHPPDFDPVLTVTCHYDPPENYANGASAATVAVDTDTGHVELLGLVMVDDCGTVINPLIVDGQMAGAAAQAVGGTLYEDVSYDEDCQPLAGSLMDYLLPTACEVPDVRLAHIETPSHVTLGGIKGMGEGGILTIPAAIACAVADALAPLGARIDALPITPERVLQAIATATSRTAP